MIHIQYNPKFYRQDYRRYIFHRQKRGIIISLVLFVVSAAVLITDYLLPGLLREQFFIKTWLFVATGIYLAYVLFHTLRALFSIWKTSKRLPIDTERIGFETGRIVLSHSKDSVVIFQRDLKGYLVLKGTVFLVSNDSKSWPVRFNPKEMSEHSFTFFMEQLELRGINRIGSDVR